MYILSKKEIMELASRQRANLINSIAGIKPVNLIGTQNSQGLANLSVVSSVFHLGASPPLFAFIIRPDSVPRDTLNNLRSHPFLTVNHVGESIVEKAHHTSARFDADISEFDECGLTKEYKDNFSAPFVKESNIKFSAKFLREIPIVENGTHMLICEIESIYMSQNYVNEDYTVDILKASSIGVAGLDTYYSLNEMGKLSYAKADHAPIWLNKSK